MSRIVGNSGGGSTIPYREQTIGQIAILFEDWQELKDFAAGNSPYAVFLLEWVANGCPSRLHPALSSLGGIDRARRRQAKRVLRANRELVKQLALECSAQQMGISSYH